jgi:predicted outer membrane protein
MVPIRRLAARQLEEPVIMKHLYLPAAAALALAACASNSTSDMAATGSPSEASAVQPMSAMDYVAAAGESDLFEIQSSQIALRKAQNADVRAFAQMMIDHHTQTSADLMAAARQAGLNPPAPSLSQEKSARVGALESDAGDRLRRPVHARAGDRSPGGVGPAPGLRPQRRPAGFESGGRQDRAHRPDTSGPRPRASRTELRGIRRPVRS